VSSSRVREVDDVPVRHSMSCTTDTNIVPLQHSRLMSLSRLLLLPLLRSTPLRPNPPPSVGEGSTRQDQVEENKVTLLLPGLPTPLLPTAMQVAGLHPG